MDLDIFLSQNKIKKENVKYAASQSFQLDEKPVLWEIRALSGDEEEKIRVLCIMEQNGKKVFDNARYLGKIAAASTVYPDLFNEKLQDSYGVWGEDELLKKMLTAGEYIEYIKKVQEVNGFSKSMNELKDEAKK
ncbi:MAG: phage portal protein [Clostridia bacterium]|jgi:hypothetical protein|nr:phage portal protein [Clostridia bacterium]